MRGRAVRGASNVFLDEWAGRRRVVLLDFGIAKLLDPGAEALTGSRKIVGTPVCMAPEQIKGTRVDARTDVYALGALVYHMLTGRPPFDDDSATVTEYLHLTAGRPRASETANVSRAIDQVIERAMAIVPDERPASVSEVAAALRRAAVSAARPDERSAAAVAAYVEGSSGEELLAAAGMTVVLRAPDALTGVAVGAALDVALDALLRAAASKARAASGDLLVLVNRGDVTLRGDEVTGGELLRLARWGRPPRAMHGIFVTKSALGADDAANDFIAWPPAATS